MKFSFHHSETNLSRQNNEDKESSNGNKWVQQGDESESGQMVLMHIHEESLSGQIVS